MALRRRDGVTRLRFDITAVRVRYQDTSASAALTAYVHTVTFTAGSIADDVLAPGISSAPPPTVGLLATGRTA